MRRRAIRPRHCANRRSRCDTDWRRRERRRRWRRGAADSGGPAGTSSSPQSQGNPLIHRWDDRPGQERSQRRAQHPGRGRIEDKPGLAVSEMSQGRPARVDDAKSPLAEHFHPGVHVEFEVVAGGNSRKNVGKKTGEGHQSDSQERCAERGALDCGAARFTRAFRRHGRDCCLIAAIGQTSHVTAR